MRRDDLAWLAVFADPFTRLGGPVCDVIGSRRVILEDDDIPISRCGRYQVAHVSNAYSDGVSGPFFSTSPQSASTRITENARKLLGGKPREGPRNDIVSPAEVR